MQRAAEILPKKDMQDADAEQQELATLQEQIDRSEQEIQGLRQSTKLLHLTLTQVEGEVSEKRQRCEEKENLIRVKKRAVELLPDADNNLAKLQALVDGSALRMVNLVGQWESHRVRLLEDYRQLRAVHQEREVRGKRWQGGRDVPVIFWETPVLCVPLTCSGIH
ncbi:hypothetical protein FKM82_026298 [Ascaphus truei]